MEVKEFVCHSCGMAREDLHFRLRIPEPLKKQIEEAAEENRRSMTAEIVSRLEDSFNPLRGVDDPDTNRQFERLASLFAQAARAAAQDDRVFFIGSRKISDPDTAFMVEPDDASDDDDAFQVRISREPEPPPESDR